MVCYICYMGVGGRLELFLCYTRQYLRVNNSTICTYCWEQTVNVSCQFSMAQLNSRGHSAQIMQPPCTSVVYANSFFPQTIGDWREPASNRPIKLLNRGLLQEILKFQLGIKILIIPSGCIAYLCTLH